MAERVIISITERSPSLQVYAALPGEGIGRDDPTPWCLLELEFFPGVSDSGDGGEVRQGAPAEGRVSSNLR